MVCQRCGKDFFEDWRKDKRGEVRFCSRKCANKKNHTDETKRKISNSLTKHEKKFCSCGKQLPRRNKNGVCQECTRLNKNSNYDYTVAWRVNAKRKLVEYKGGKCCICGYNKCDQALDFHHVDQSTKEFSISSRIRSFSKILEEVDKCILVCSNCHREIHYGIISICDLSL